ncbi:MAG: hypothetical protein Q8P18_22055 [Pseudomonadota bacterium]|nr:hypothetical protein [Pseudomonadota bacterium]
MSRQKRTPGLGDVPVTRARGGARDRLRDAGGKELALLAKKVGNSQVGALLGAATEKRDALLAFVERRLSEIQMVQRAEQKEMGDQREWHLRVARGATGFALPDPTRWHKTTQLYRRAAEALCAGDLSRGAHLLDQAVAAERAAFDTVPSQVELPAALAAPSSTPEERPFVAEGEHSPAAKAPALFQRADEILRVTDTSAPVAVERDRPKHHWWDAPEEEEEGGKKAESKSVVATPSASAETQKAKPEAPEKQIEEEVAPAKEVAREAPAVASAPPASSPKPPAPARKTRRPDGR